MWRSMSFLIVIVVLAVGVLAGGCPPDKPPPQNPDLETTGPQDVVGGSALDLSLTDGTRLQLPPIETIGPVTQVTLEEASGVIDLGTADQETIGTACKVRFESFNPEALGFSASDFVPQITIPAAFIAGFDPEALTVFRVADFFFGDEALPGTENSLPVYFADNGDVVVNDFYFPDSIMSDLGYEAAKKSGRIDPAAEKQILHPREIRYVAGTFAGSINWTVEPVLEKVYPYPDTAPARRTWSGLSQGEQDAEDAKILTNFVVLVHGHNEEEKVGNAPFSAEWPWYYAYKRDVWTYFFEYINQNAPELADCTGFYEFIYPTYWPIFTPQPGTTRLDEEFAYAVNQLIAGHTRPGKEVRLYIVAHSMGGLVARAGIQLFNNTTHTAFEKLVTWGSPHMGSPLVSVRYVLGAPAGIYRAGPDGVVNFPLGNIDRTLFALRRAIDDMQVDAPGTRDLRWANSHTTTPRGLALDTLFSFDQDAAANPALWNLYDLDQGTEIHNQNLNLLNANDVYRLSNKYNALFGVTTARATISFPWTNWFRPTISSTGPPLGARVMPWLVDDPDGAYEGHSISDSDGALPIVSMAGAGVAGTRTDVGDIDHEQYFGAPDERGIFHAPELAQTTAQRTFTALGIACPPPGQRTFNISGSFTRTNPRNAYPMTVQGSTSMSVTVRFDGAIEPVLEDDPTYENVKRIRVAGQIDPITIVGSHDFTISPMEYRYDHGWFYEVFKIKKTEFQHCPAQVGNTQIDTGTGCTLPPGGFTWTYSADPAWPWDEVYGPYQPDFSVGATVVTFTVTRFNADSNEEISSREETKILEGYSSASGGLIVKFSLS